MSTPPGERKLVSILTPTYGRPELLRECIDDVCAQTYPSIEHVIVADGLDPQSMEIAEQAKLNANIRTTVTTATLGRNWSSYLIDSFCAAPVVVAQLLARGDYQCFWADDERADPEHIEKLVNLLEATGADFAYSRVRMRRVHCETTWEIGTDPPSEGQITNAVYRTSLLRHGLYPFGAGMTSDWACIRRWMDASARWAYLPEVTFSHVAHH